MNECLLRSTLFFHKDILTPILMSRTYSRGVQSWKLDGGILADQHTKRQVVIGVMPHQYFMHLVVHQSHDITTMLQAALALS